MFCSTTPLTAKQRTNHAPPPLADCLHYFADYGPTFVEWINDSCCNVLFADTATANRAVVGLGKPLPPEEMPDLQGGCLAAWVAWWLGVFVLGWWVGGWMVGGFVLLCTAWRGGWVTEQACCFWVGWGFAAVWNSFPFLCVALRA
jgi:hypothetical protein